MKNKLFPLIAIVALFVSACNIINPSEDVPAYLIIEEAVLTTTSEQGSNAHNVVDAWVYVDNEFLGVYKLPARIPVLESGISTVDIQPGIKLNSINATSDFYPFFDTYQTEVEFVSGEEVSLTPLYTYSDLAVFDIVESFEGVNHNMNNEIDGDIETSFELTTSGSFEGGSIVATLVEGHQVVEAGSDLITTFPTAGFRSFFEMNYKTDVDLFVGVIGYDTSGGEVYSDFEYGVRPTEEWKKIYIDFTEYMSALAAEPTLVSYRVVLSAGLNPNLLDELPTARVYVDNLKLIRF